MRLSKVRRVLTHRLGYLNAKIATGRSPGLVEERDALDTLMRCQGMLDPVEVAACTAKCAAVVVPAVERNHVKARRFEALASECSRTADALFVAIHGSVDRRLRTEERAA